MPPETAASLPTRKSWFERPARCFANGCTRRQSASCRAGRRLCPPRPEGQRNKGVQATTVLTVNGRLSVRRTVYWSAQGGTVIPTDQWLGLAEHRVSPGVREMCCREALHCSFEVASDNLQRTAQLFIGGRSLREIVENQGRAVLSAQQKGSLPPAFTAAGCAGGALVTGAGGG